MPPQARAQLGKNPAGGTGAETLIGNVGLVELDKRFCRRRAARLVLRCARVAGPVGAVGIDVERPRGALDDLFRDYDLLDAFEAR
jgi:hypothetical protein